VDCERGAGEVAVSEPDQGAVAVGFHLGVDALPLQPAPRVGEEPARSVRPRGGPDHFDRIFAAIILDALFWRAGAARRLGRVIHDVPSELLTMLGLTLSSRRTGRRPSA
jgi:hypothetical protein